MNIYTQRLAAGQASTTGFHAAYTVPAGKLVVLRDVVLIQHGITTGQVSLLLSPTGGGNPFVASVPTVTPEQTYHWDVRQVLYAGDVLTVYNSQGTVDWLLTGYVFDVP